MNSFSFRNRIALNYIITTALLIGFVFIIIYLVVSLSVSNHLDEHLKREADRHSKEIEVKDGIIRLEKLREWMEREHNSISVDPVFIEFLDINGNLIDKSPNLKGGHLSYDVNKENHEFFNTELAHERIRQVQILILDQDGKSVGRLLVAVVREGSEVVLETLWHIFFITYPLILIVLFFVARFIAGKSIKPINDIINTSNKITRDNLTSRIPLPENKDELYILSDTINELLNRIERTLEREKSFTSYASHEFRTPLAVLKGTLEILIRKPRQQEEYHEKVKYCINEIDRLNHLVDELLVLTRYESQKQSLALKNTNLNTFFDNSIKQLSQSIGDKNIQIDISSPVVFKQIKIKTDVYLFSTIITNLLSNAIKYSYQNGKIQINTMQDNNIIICEIIDNGIGIPQIDREKVFDKFYRSTDHVDIKGFGLGLAIVKRFSSLLNIDVSVLSEEGKGTTIKLEISQS